ADDNLNPENLDDQECIICSEQGKKEIEIPMFYVKVLSPFHKIQAYGDVIFITDFIS
ncbi:hypothetical protein AVEN_163335-1, partial [Araneus ventricosus]